MPLTDEHDELAEQRIEPFDGSADELIAGMDACHRWVSAGQRELLRFIDRADRAGLWRDDGAMDMAHWVAFRYGISWWKADRWVRAAHAL